MFCLVRRRRMVAGSVPSMSSGSSVANRSMSLPPSSRSSLRAL